MNINEVSPGKNVPKIVNAIIEIPAGSVNKYELDKETGLLKLDRPMYSSVLYPGDYGFIPQTLWEDNDPLDILVLTSKPVYPLTLAEVRPLGVIQMIDSGEKDYKILGVYNSDPRFKNFSDIKQIPQHVIREIVNFFEIYKELQGKKCKIVGIKGKSEAYKDIKKAMELYQKSKK